MKPTAKPQVKRPRMPPLREEEPRIDNVPPPPIVMRPDGYYWQAPDGKQDVGPFATLEAARADRDAADDRAPEPGETLQEAESEIGIADWIDPHTGEPAEGLSPPHLESE